MSNINNEELSTEDQEFGIWLQNGIDRGWITEPFCSTHDGGYQYMSEEELEDWEAGGDPCQHVLRIMV